MTTSQTSTSARRSILIVEDEAIIAMMLEEFVEALGHDVRGVAATVEDACRIVRDGGFDLAILDCHLNGEDVWPAADVLDRSGIPFILSSGGSLSAIPEAYAARPMLAKPYTIGAISEILSSCLVPES